MPLTRGKKAERVPCEMAVGSDKENGDSGEEITSDQEEVSRGEDPIEFRKWKLELEIKAKAEERQMALEIEKEKMALELEK